MALSSLSLSSSSSGGSCSSSRQQAQRGNFASKSGSRLLPSSCCLGGYYCGRVRTAMFLCVAVRLLSIITFGGGDGGDGSNDNVALKKNHHAMTASALSSVIPEKRKKNVTLVVVLGNLRGGEKSWQSLYRNVLDINNADLALVVGATGATERNSSMYGRAKFVWEFPEYEDWSVAMDSMNITSRNPSYNWRNVTPQGGRETYKEKSTIFGGTSASTGGSSAINLYARYLLSQRIRELSLQDAYEGFVITRSDHYYACHHRLDDLDVDVATTAASSSSHNIWHPNGEDYGGLQDRHVYCSGKDVLDVLNMLPPVIEHPERYVSIRAKNPETLTAVRYEEMGLTARVRRFPRMMFLAASPEDGTRWKKPQWTILNDGADGHHHPTMRGLGVKYTTEFFDAIATCNITDIWVGGTLCLNRQCRSPLVGEWCAAPPCSGNKTTQLSGSRVRMVPRRKGGQPQKRRRRPTPKTGDATKTA